MTSRTGIVEPGGKTPLYHRIYLILRQRIREGSHPAGTLLPSEHALAASFGVSRITSRRALDELVAEGLARRERGRGTRVIGAAPAGPERPSIEGLIENVSLWGARTEVEILDFGPAPASAPAARALAVPIGTELHRCVRVRRLDGVPLGHVTSYVPADIGTLFTRDELAATPLLALLERKGISAARADQVITAALADPDVAPLLAVEVGAPLLRKIRTVHDEAGRAVEYIEVLYRPDMYQFRLSLERDAEGSATRWSAVA